jgi:hypothetical protein
MASGRPGHQGGVRRRGPGGPTPPGPRPSTTSPRRLGALAPLLGRLVREPFSSRYCGQGRAFQPGEPHEALCRRSDDARLSGEHGSIDGS